MEAIWKFPLDIEDEVKISMPRGAKILCVQTQRNVPYLWAIVDIEASKEVRTFVIYGTGPQHEKIRGKYIGTFQALDESFVGHVFELK